MAEYINFQSILNAALGEYQEKGFRLTESSPTTLTLFHQDEKVGDFSTPEVLIPRIQKACENWLTKVGVY